MSAQDSVEKKSLVGSLHDEKPPPPHVHVDNAIENINAKLANPLAGLSHEQLMNDGAEFARAHGLEDLEDIFRKGALAAQDPLAFEGISNFTEAEKDIFRRELTHRWDQPATLYYLVIMCSVAAAVQGVSCGGLMQPWERLANHHQMDEAVINGANLFFAPQFHIDPNEGNTSRNQWLLGLVNAAPYVGGTTQTHFASF